MVLPCVVCLGPTEPAVQASVNAGLVVLLSVTGLVLLGVALFITRLVRAAGRHDPQ